MNTELSVALQKLVGIKQRCVGLGFAQLVDPDLYEAVK